MRRSYQQFLSPILEVNISWVVLERDGEVLFEDEVEDHHHLHRCLDTPTDAVANLKGSGNTCTVKSIFLLALANISILCEVWSWPPVM